MLPACRGRIPRAVLLDLSDSRLMRDVACIPPVWVSGGVVRCGREPCVVLTAGCALLAIPVSLPAHCDSSSQMLGHFAAPTQPAISPAGVHPPTLDAPLIQIAPTLLRLFGRPPATGTRFQTGVAQPPQRCIPVGRACFGPGRPRCCPAPFPHHSFCSNRRGWGICVES